MQGTAGIGLPLSQQPVAVQAEGRQYAYPVCTYISHEPHVSWPESFWKVLA